MRELRQLRLPQLVEARRKRESIQSDADSPELPFVGDTLYLSLSSTSSDTQSPSTPTFSLRGHSRFPSSNSSLASSPTMRESFDGFNAPKRPLTEVKEEPQEREEDADAMEEFQQDQNEMNNVPRSDSVSADMSDAEYILPNLLDYDWVDTRSFNSDSESINYSKRRRPDDSPLAGMTSRLGSRFPSFSRNRKSAKEASTISTINTFKDTPISRSRANSTRAPSLIESTFDASERREYQCPPTPTRSFREQSRDNSSPVSPIDIQKANACPPEDYDMAEEMATTPLLPPVMTQFSSKLIDEPIQSPLQSPKVAESSSVVQSPIGTPRIGGLPSPPLSTRPSVSSFHHRQVVPSSEIPPILLADPQDEWANKLGHANFTIRPEPYLPEVCNMDTCKKLHADWDTARCNFTRHLARTGENYSTTSKIHQLTEEKWAQIDHEWERNHEIAWSKAKARSNEALPLSKQTSLPGPVTPTKIPTINGPRSEGKFPKVGDEGIVGPMARNAPILQPRSSRKRAFWKFLQGVLPSSVAFGRGSSP